MTVATYNMCLLIKENNQNLPHNTFDNCSKFVFKIK